MKFLRKLDGNFQRMIKKTLKTLKENFENRSIKFCWVLRKVFNNSTYSKIRVKSWKKKNLRNIIWKKNWYWIFFWKNFRTLRISIDNIWVNFSLSTNNKLYLGKFWVATYYKCGNFEQNLIYILCKTLKKI